VPPEGGTRGLWRQQAMVVQELSYPPTSMTVGHNFLASGGQQGQVSHVNRACPTRVSSPKALQRRNASLAGILTPGFLTAHLLGLLQLDVYNLAEGKSVYSGAVGDNVNNCAQPYPGPAAPGFAPPCRERESLTYARASHGVCAALHVGRSRTGEKSLLVSNNDCTIKVLNLPTLQSLASFSFPIAINYSSMSPDGDHLVCVGDSEQVYLYNTRGGAPPAPPR
jgi:WD40 repeat protein